MNDSAATEGADYRVLARKYRPQSFEDLIGQEALVRTLTNAMKAGRIAQAFILTGVRGPKGGHLLAKNPEEITLGEIVRLFEGQSELVECISNPEHCDMSDDCQVRLAWKDATKWCGSLRIKPTVSINKIF